MSLSSRHLLTNHSRRDQREDQESQDDPVDHEGEERIALQELHQEGNRGVSDHGGDGGAYSEGQELVVHRRLQLRRRPHLFCPVVEFFESGGEHAGEREQEGEAGGGGACEAGEEAGGDRRAAPRPAGHEGQRLEESNEKGVGRGYRRFAADRLTAAEAASGVPLGQPP